MSKYKVVFFDLDHTLWDFNRNSAETLQELHAEHQLDKEGIDFEKFLTAFNSVNTDLWDKYDRGLIDRSVIRYQRFKIIFESLLFANNTIAESLSAQYLELSPRKGHLVEGALEILQQCHRRLPLFVITNGFTEVQHRKARSGGIENYFDGFITSEHAGHKKPAPEIFDFALKNAGFGASEAVMIGDNLLTDIGGAQAANIDSVFFNPERVPHQATPTYEIEKLAQLPQIIGL